MFKDDRDPITKSGSCAKLDNMSTSSASSLTVVEISNKKVLLLAVVSRTKLLSAVKFCPVLTSEKFVEAAKLLTKLLKLPNVTLFTPVVIKKLLKPASAVPSIVE